MYIVSLKDVLKVLKKNKQTNFNPEIVRRTMLRYQPNFYDENGTPFWTVRYQDNYDAAVEGFLTELDVQ